MKSILRKKYDALYCSGVQRKVRCDKIKCFFLLMAREREKITFEIALEWAVLSLKILYCTARHSGDMRHSLLATVLHIPTRHTLPYFDHSVFDVKENSFERIDRLSLQNFFHDKTNIYWRNFWSDFVDQKYWFSKAIDGQVFAFLSYRWHSSIALHTCCTLLFNLRNRLLGYHQYQ